MATFRIVTDIAVPVEVYFNSARDIDILTRSLDDTGERDVAGHTRGLIGMGESVTWPSASG